MSLTEVKHKKFTYVLIPACMDDEVEERQYEGKEEGFQQTLKNHFSREQLLQREKEKFKDDLSQKAKGKLTDDQLYALAGGEHSYQIVPLELPSKTNGFLATNAYIDSIGRVKELPCNARASRVCSTDIRGDCFLSKTFDDEEEFRRVDLTKADYEQLLQHPPEAKGRWSETAALNQLLTQQQQQQASAAAPVSAENGEAVAVAVRVERKQQQQNVDSRAAGYSKWTTLATDSSRLSSSSSRRKAAVAPQQEEQQQQEKEDSRNTVAGEAGAAGGGQR